MNRDEWLRNLKAGDEVAVCDYSGTNEFLFISHVGHITPKGGFYVGGSSYSKDGYSTLTMIRPATKRFRDWHLRETILDRLNEIHVLNLTATETKEILRVIEKAEARLGKDSE